MEGFFAEKSNITKLPINSEQIDLTLKLSPCGQQDAEEKWVTSERGLMRFGDLQTMRRVRTGKRLLLEKQRRAAAEAAAATAEADKFKFKTLATNPCGNSWHQGGGGGAISNIQIPLRPLSDTSKLESPAKKVKHVNPYLKKGDAMEILRQMPSVSTTGDGHGGKRIEGLLYKYKGGQVCIVCVCHGSFLSPAEFVMHAGGKEDVVDPMKHITILSDSFYIKGDGSVFIS